MTSSLAASDLGRSLNSGWATKIDVGQDMESPISSARSWMSWKHRWPDTSSPGHIRHLLSSLPYTGVTIGGPCVCHASKPMYCQLKAETIPVDSTVQQRERCRSLAAGQCTMMLAMSRESRADASNTAGLRRCRSDTRGVVRRDDERSLAGPPPCVCLETSCRTSSSAGGRHPPPTAAGSVEEVWSPTRITAPRVEGIHTLRGSGGQNDPCPQPA